MVEQKKRLLGPLGLFALLLLLTALACALPGAAPTVEAPVAGALETSVAETVTARDALELQVEQTVAAELAANQGQDETAEAPDLVAPDAQVTAIRPTADPSATTCQLRIILSSVNVRSGPGTNYRPVSALLKDAVVPVVAKNSTGSWLLIELPGGSRGWVADSVSDPVNAAACNAVEVAATIPAPPPTATAIPTPTPTPTTAATTAAATNSTLTILNNHAYAISEVYYVLSTSSGSWGSDMNGGRLIFTGDQGDFTVNNGIYDIAIVFNNDTYYDAYDVNINGPHTVTVTGPTTSVITVSNGSQSDICAVEWFGPFTTFIEQYSPPLAPGSTDTFDLPILWTGKYDFDVYGCTLANPAIYSVTGIDTHAGYTLNVPSQTSTTSTITVENLHSVEIRDVFARISGTSDWGPERLGQGIRVPPNGGFGSFDVSNGAYDIWIIFPDDTFTRIDNVNFNGPNTISVPGPDRSAITVVNNQAEDICFIWWATPFDGDWENIAPLAQNSSTTFFLPKLNSEFYDFEAWACDQTIAGFIDDERGADTFGGFTFTVD